MDAVTAAFSGLIDYAGLFPPAGLAPADVVRQYGRYRTGPHAWMLGRLVLPVHLLDEAAALAPGCGARVDAPWPVSALVGGMDEIESSSRVSGHCRGSCLRVEAIETVAGATEEIAAIATSWPSDLERFVEIPAEPDPAPLVESIARAECAVKLRAGGVTPAAFPSSEAVARFLVRVRGAGVRMKATAGLHHALRGAYRLTYDADSPTGTMHGFVNLVFAAALLAAGKGDEKLTTALLEDDRPEVFKFGGRAGSWLNAVLTYGEFAHGRETLLRSIGSCSFDEPTGEIAALDFGLNPTV